MDEPRKHYANLQTPGCKATCCLIPFMWHVQNRQIHRDRREVEMGMGSNCLMGPELPFADENILSLVVAVAQQLFEYTKNHWIVHFKKVNFMVCEL